ncbi:MAG: phosphoglycerate kinase [Holosporales bacterium]|jgi:phosphoglycerate kinase|nr:phosphoglycerate kinase [Holosporales bacterium]
MKTLNEADRIGLAGKKILLRVDFNVSIEDGKIQDDTKIQDSIPTIQYLKDRNAAVILCSHIVSSEGPASLKPVADRLSSLMELSVKFCPSCVGSEAIDAASKMRPGDVLLLENIRSVPFEEENTDQFAKEIASMADIYVNDAFSVSHRKHASIIGIPKYLPSYAGLFLQETLLELNRHIKNPTRPLMAIVGGKKVSSKLRLLQSLAMEVDVLFVAGAMANTFLLAKGIPIGQSLFEPDLLDTARCVVETAKRNACKLILPSDVVLDDGRTVSINDIGDDNMILDVGARFVDEILNCARQHKTVWWNGPLGKFEAAPFDVGTKLLAKGLADTAKTLGVRVIVGGGDTVHALKKAGVNSKDYTYVSTAGGAFLEFIQDLTLPGIEALESIRSQSTTKVAWA